MHDASRLVWRSQTFYALANLFDGALAVKIHLMGRLRMGADYARLDRGMHGSDCILNQYTDLAILTSVITPLFHNYLALVRLL